MQIETLSTSDVQKLRNKEHVRIEPDEVLRNVELIRVGEGVSEFGPFFTLDVDDGNNVGTILASEGSEFGDQMKTALTTKDRYGRRIIRPHLRGVKVYIGKTALYEVKGTDKKTCSFVWGVEEPNEY